VTNAQLINLPRRPERYCVRAPDARRRLHRAHQCHGQLHVRQRIRAPTITHGLDGGYDIDTGGNWACCLRRTWKSSEEVRPFAATTAREFGTGGGSQFNVITRNGTNQIHGSAYESCAIAP